MDHMTGLMVGLLKVVRAAEGGSGNGEAQRRLDAQIRKLEKWNRLSHSVRTEREALFQELRYLSESGSDEELFRRALEVVSIRSPRAALLTPLSPGRDRRDDEPPQPAEARCRPSQQAPLLELLLSPTKECRRAALRTPHASPQSVSCHYAPQVVRPENISVTFSCFLQSYLP